MGATFTLHIDAADVFPDDGEGDELGAAKEGHDGGETCPAPDGVEGDIGEGDIGE